MCDLLDASAGLCGREGSPSGAATGARCPWHQCGHLCFCRAPPFDRPTTTRRAGLLAPLLALLVAAAAAGTAAGVPAATPAPGLDWVPGYVLVRFKPGPAAAKVAAMQAAAPVVPGLRLTGLVGTPAYEAIKLPGTTGGGPGAAAVGPTPGLPADAVFRYRVVDGLTVPQKVAQLRAHYGERLARAAGRGGTARGGRRRPARHRSAAWPPAVHPCSCGRGGANLRAAPLCRPRRPSLPAQRPV